MRRTRKQTRKSLRKGTQLYNDNPRGSPVTRGTGYKNKEAARRTINLIRKKPLVYQKQVITTMYYRAKHHKHQTEDMKKAMAIYKKWLNQAQSGSI
jgi:hypothetical protein